MRSGRFVAPMNVPWNFEIMWVTKHDSLPWKEVRMRFRLRTAQFILRYLDLSLGLDLLSYAIFTSMAFGFAFSDLGKCTLRTPSLYSALTLVPSASSGMVKLRTKLP